MLPLILGLMCGASSSEISKLMSETTKRHREAAEELIKEEEAKNAQIVYEREKFNSILDNLYAEFEEWEYFVDSESMQEEILNMLEDMCYSLKIDKIMFFELLLKKIKDRCD